MAGEKAQSADGSPATTDLPKDRRTAGEATRHAVISGMEAVGSIGPVRKAARWLYHSTLSLVWRRHRRKQDAEYGDPRGQ